MSELSHPLTHEIFDAEEFYKRQLVLRELGPEGQSKLRSSTVAVVGVGGLGSVAALYLALAGVGKLRLIDQDTVELHNLHRQVLYSVKDLRYPKVEAAARRISEVNPSVAVDPISENVRENNVEELIEGASCVVDGLDNMRTRYLVNRACIKRKIPYVFGGAIGFEGNVSVFAPPETPCLECLYPNLNDAELPTCETRGVLGATVGIIGAIEAMEAIKVLARIEGSLKGKILVCDFIGNVFFLADVVRSPFCKSCGLRADQKLERAYKLTWLCGSRTVNVNPPSPVQLDLRSAHDLLSSEYRILLKSALALVFNYDEGVEVSLFKHGRALIKNVNSEEEALKVYKNVMGKLGVSLPC